MNKFPRYMRKENWPKPEEETFGQALFSFICMVVFLAACVLLGTFIYPLVGG